MEFAGSSDLYSKYEKNAALVSGTDTRGLRDGG
jgi:hypothetical protein